MENENPVRVIFTQRAVMADASGNVSFEAQPNDVRDLRADQAQRWIRRGMAEIYDPEKHAADQEGEAPPPPAGRKGRQAGAPAA